MMKNVTESAEMVNRLYQYRDVYLTTIKQLHRFDVGFAEIAALEGLREECGTSEIGEHYQLSKSMLSATLTNLLLAGLIAPVQVIHGDRRLKHYQVTTAGEKMLDQCLGVVNKTMVMAEEQLNALATEEDQHH
ncbi:hypothetical protein [Furfurilactobacillus entadae]|uniref:hypothetical protein n=1 Tax=Furfurilactobacillus entadae TaxID=2922307 RepID=UPI0035E4AF60